MDGKVDRLVIQDTPFAVLPLHYPLDYTCLHRSYRIDMLRFAHVLHHPLFKYIAPIKFFSPPLTLFIERSEVEYESNY